jgi:hypothetical protein
MDVIQVDLDARIFNPISSTILIWLWFKAVGWRHDFQPMVWDCLIVRLLLLGVLIVGIFWLHHNL